MTKADRKRILRALDKDKRTQAWLARELGITPSHLNHWLQGRRACPAERLDQIKATLGMK